MSEALMGGLIDGANAACIVLGGWVLYLCVRRWSRG